MRDVEAVIHTAALHSPLNAQDELPLDESKLRFNQNWMHVTYIDPALPAHLLNLGADSCVEG